MLRALIGPFAGAYAGAIHIFTSSQSTTEAVSLGVVPIFHITGLLFNVLAPVYLRSTTILMPRWDREPAGRLISRHQVTRWT